MTTTDIANAILDGELDGQLDTIANAISNRQRYLRDRKAAENQAALTPGDRIVLCGSLRPKYLLGRTGVVAADQSGRRPGDILVDMDWPPGGRYRQYGLGIPAHCCALYRIGER